MVSINKLQLAIAMLRAKCAKDFAYADNWTDLIRRLFHLGIMLREAGGGLALFSAPSGARLCKASEMGYSLNQLGRRFAAGSFLTGLL